MRRTSKSRRAFARAQRHIPGGVDSPVRAFKGVGGTPFFASKGKGSRIYDLDGNAYIDCVCSWGPLILGHSPPEVAKALKGVIKDGFTFGVPTEIETKLASLIKSCIPSIDQLRFVNSGTEATMSAVRLARGFTGRDRIVKFEGCYHGHGDSFLVKAGSGVATLGLPSSAGVSRKTARDTINLSYNDAEALSRLVKKNKESIACVILEPVAGNMGVVPPKKRFLADVREITEKHGIVLIFDEVITGFRIGLGGAQGMYGIVPDLEKGDYGQSRTIRTGLSGGNPVRKPGRHDGRLPYDQGPEEAGHLREAGANGKEAGARDQSKPARARTTSSIQQGGLDVDSLLRQGRCL
jgi:glutamate-1-semialdehyde 2,1-aminomutase